MKLNKNTDKENVINNNKSFTDSNDFFDKLVNKCLIIQQKNKTISTNIIDMKITKGSAKIGAEESKKAKTFDNEAKAAINNDDLSDLATSRKTSISSLKA